MNNSAAIYIEHPDQHAVIAELERQLAVRGFARADLRPADLDGRMMLPAKRVRHFFVLPAAAGWVTLWEDPRYFADRDLARQLAAGLGARAVWIEVSGNGVSWARGLYAGAETVEERYEEVKTPFYGEHGSVHFVYDIDTSPEEFIANLGLPYDEYHYESVLLGELPLEAGAPTHLAFER